MVLRTGLCDMSRVGEVLSCACRESVSEFRKVAIVFATVLALVFILVVVLGWLVQLAPTEKRDIIEGVVLYRPKVENKMHELGIAREMLEIALAYAAKNNAAHITALNVEMSAAADESEESLRFHIENAARGTAAEGARVEFTRLPAQAKCLDCGNEFAMDAAPSGCSRCSSQRVVPLVRDEFRLASIDVE